MTDLHERMNELSDGLKAHGWKLWVYILPVEDIAK